MSRPAPLLPSGAAALPGGREEEGGAAWMAMRARVGWASSAGKRRRRMSEEAGRSRSESMQKSRFLRRASDSTGGEESRRRRVPMYSSAPGWPEGPEYTAENSMTRALVLTSILRIIDSAVRFIRIKQAVRPSIFELHSCSESAGRCRTSTGLSADFSERIRLDSLL